MYFESKQQGSTIVPSLRQLPFYLIRGMRYHAAKYFYTPRPTYSSLRVTRRCNSRCIMCMDWRRPPGQKELTISEVSRIYSNRLFSSLKRISFSGGEPTIRDDLVQIAEVILDSCLQIREMMLITNGFECDLVTERVQELLALCARRKLRKLSVSISIDGYGDTHEQIRRVPGAFNKAVTTIKKLRLLKSDVPLYLSSTCVVQPLNIDSLFDLLQFGNELELPITLVPVRKPPIANDDGDQENSLVLTGEHREKLRCLLESKLQPYLVPSNALFWREYFMVNGGSQRVLPCYLLHDFVEIDSDGTLRMCVQRNDLLCGNALDEPPDKIWYSNKAREIRKVSRDKYCRDCADCCDLDTALKEEFFYYAGHWLKEKLGVFS